MPKEPDDRTLEPFTPKAGDSVGRFVIEASLGAGGMGEVFLARDPTLHRKVALKFLPARSAVDPAARARFTREAQAAAQLSHPNIVHIYEVGEHRGYPYLAMEHIQGESLREVIRRGELRTEDAMHLCRQVAEGLAEAHAAKVVHRDIKPSNVVLDHHGSPKLLDFGLATIADRHELTRPGSTLGTVGYMSPEQVRGEPADHRSDLFSLGVVLYEMITGRTPFTKDSDTATLEAILRERHEPLRRYKADVPEGLERIVDKLLEKDRETRYQSAQDLAADLKREQRLLDDSRWVATSHVSVASGSQVVSGGRGRSRLWMMAVAAVVIVGGLLVVRPWQSPVSPVSTAAAGENRLLVMYFQNLTDPEDENRLGQIAADLVITELSRSRDLQVVSNQRLFDILRQLGNPGRRVEDPALVSRAAQKAEARWMLTGSILQTEPNFVITAQLVDVGSGHVAASERISGGTGETLFDAMDALTAKLRGDLALPSAASPEPDLAQTMTGSTEAYRLYLEGVEKIYMFLYQDAQHLMERVLAIDPEFLMAYYYLASLELDIGNYTRALSYLDGALARIDKGTRKQQLMVRALYAGARGEWREAREYRLQILDIDPQDKEVLLNMTTGANTTHQEALGYLRRILELDPEYKSAYNMLAYVYARAGSLGKALGALDDYQRIAPEEPNPLDSRGDVYMLFGRFEEAEKWYSQAYARNASFVPSLQKIGVIHLLEKDFDQARATFRAVQARGGIWEQLGSSGLINVEIHRGRFATALDMLDVAPGFPEKDRLQLKAWLYLTLEEPDAARTLAEEAQAKGTDDFDLLRALELRARASMAQGKVEDVAACLEEGRQKLGRVLEADRHLEALAAEARGDYDVAIEKLSFPEGSFPEFPAVVELGRVQLLAGHPDQALAVLEPRLHCYERDRFTAPELDVLYHYYLGMAYEGTGDTASAAAQYREFLGWWGNADHNLSEVRDAQARLKALGT